MISPLMKIVAIKSSNRKTSESESYLRPRTCTVFVRHFRLNDVQTFTTLKIVAQTFN